MNSGSTGEAKGLVYRLLYQESGADDGMGVPSEVLRITSAERCGWVFWGKSLG